MSPEHWQQIEQLYHATRERPAAERAAYLAEACPDDESLRREVELLLAANEQASGFLTAPALQPEAQDLAAEKASAPLGSLIGQQLSHYKILSRIGAGGMGEVYLARDASLERRVALKLLPAKFTEDAERLQRFVREAKSASALNHPNIITIYEIGEAVSATGKTHFIATEFIEGETLRQRMAPQHQSEGVTLREALEIAIQVAAALDAAHKAGIVHRDIKPENLMVRPDGLVKVLDFGLAKLTTAQTSGANKVDTNAETLPQEMKTQPGMILGTLRYMSPEQARGRALDARTDIFSLGVVLYELLTGQPLFAGETSADVIAAIIHKEPVPLAERVSEATPELERIVRKALAKDSRERYQDARDLQIDLQTLKQDSELSARLARSGHSQAPSSDRLAASAAAQPMMARFLSQRALLALPAVILLLGALWWLASRRNGSVEAPPPASLKHAEVVTWLSAPGEIYSVGSFSPDGKWVAFASTKSGSKNIWVRQTGSGEDHQSTKDEFGNDYPIWSPAGDEIAFFSRARSGQPGIWRMPMLGGTPTLLKLLPLGEGDAKLRRWSKDGATIYYEAKQQLFALEVKTGQTTQLTNFDLAQVKVNSNSINISSDGQSIAYIITEANNHRSVWVMPVRGGPPKRIADHVGGTRNAFWHPDGKRVFYSSNVEGTLQIFVADVGGHQPAQITFNERESFVVDVATDGTKVLYGSATEESDIWGVKVSEAEEFPVASDISAELWPDVSPDNQTVAYQAVRNLSQGDKIENCAILTKPLGSTGEPFVLARDGFLPKWSPDGKQIAFMRREKSGYNLQTINVTGGPAKTLVTGQVRSADYDVLPYTLTQASNFSWAPDGNKLAYCSTRDGLRNLRLVSTDGSSDTQITNNNDANLFVFCPLWSADGKRLAYATKPNKIVTPQDNIFSFWVIDLAMQKAKPLVQMNARIRLLGWLRTDQELLFVRSYRERPEISLLRVSTISGKQSSIAELPAANYYNIYLSPDRRMIAYVSHQDGKDNIWVIPVGGGAARKLTANNDPRLYFSSLAWSPASRTIYYGKQSRYSLLSMITNFK